MSRLSPGGGAGAWGVPAGGRPRGSTHVPMSTSTGKAKRCAYPRASTPWGLSTHQLRGPLLPSAQIATLRHLRASPVSGGLPGLPAPPPAPPAPPALLQPATHSFCRTVIKSHLLGSLPSSCFPPQAGKGLPVPGSPLRPDLPAPPGADARALSRGVSPPAPGALWRRLSDRSALRPPGTQPRHLGVPVLSWALGFGRSEDAQSHRLRTQTGPNDSQAA